MKKNLVVQKRVNNFDLLIAKKYTSMEEKKEDFPMMIIQPNAITNARYEYSQMQKDFVYHLIDKMNKFMTKDKSSVKDLFGLVVVEMELKDIVKSDNYTPMLDAIKDLQRRPIQFNYMKEDGEYEISTHLIATLQHKKGSGKIKITTTEASLGFIAYIGSGFTAYNKSIALSLPSLYAKRMYELCCRWKDKGFCRMPISEFRKMMMIENKFKQHGEMVKNVLDISEKILKEQAELTFTYTFRKENRSKAYNWLELNILPTAGENGDKKSGWYQVLYNILYGVYWDNTAVQVCDYIADHDNLKKAAERFKRLQKDIDSGKLKTHGIMAYVNRVLIDEYEIPENLVISKEEKKKRKKAEAKIETYKAIKVAAEKAVKTKEAKKKEGLDEIRQVIQKIQKDAEERAGKPQSMKEIFKVVT